MFGAYGIAVDPRHLCLLADFMTQQVGWAQCATLLCAPHYCVCALHYCVLARSGLEPCSMLRGGGVGKVLHVHKGISVTHYWSAALPA